MLRGDTLDRQGDNVTGTIVGFEFGFFFDLTDAAGHILARFGLNHGQQFRARVIPTHLGYAFQLGFVNFVHGLDFILTFINFTLPLV
jgi:hypothetical protein